MTRILLVLMTVFGLNAAEIPAHIGNALNSVGAAGGNVTQSVASIAGNLNLGGLNLGNLNVGDVAQASMLGGLAPSASTPVYVGRGNISSSAPINVGKVNVAASRSKGLSLSF